MKKYIIFLFLLISWSFNYSQTSFASVDILSSWSATPDATIGGIWTVCDGQSANLTITLTNPGSSGWDVIYTDGSTQVAINIVSSPYILPVTPTTTTTYTLVNVNNGDCDGIVNGAGVVIVNDLPVINISGVDPALCAGDNTGTATVNVVSGTSPYLYAWDGGVWQQATNSHLSAGMHYVTVTDDHGCQASDSVTIGEHSPLAVAGETVTHINCNGVNSGAISIVNIGGTAPYTCSWTGGLTGDVITGLSAGNYSVTVVDYNGCSVSYGPIVVTESAGIMSFIESNDIVDVLCYNGGGGEATVHATGGTNTYSYLWSNTQNSATATGLSAGVYSVTVTDGDGCTSISDATISQPTELITIFSSDDISCDGLVLGEASVVVTGGVLPYTYTWDGVTDVNNSISDLSLGTHSLVLLDANGCYPTGYNPKTFTLVQDPMPIVSISSSGTGSSCGGSPVDLTANASGGGTYTYLWSNGMTDSSIIVTPLVSTTYDVTVTNSYGSECIVVASVVVDVHELPIFTNNIPTSLCEDVSSIDLSLFVSDTASVGHNYYFVGPNIIGTDFMVNSAGNGVYSFTIQCHDQTTNCVDEVIHTLEINALPDVQLSLVEDEFCLNTGIEQLTGAYPLGGFWTGAGVDSIGELTMVVAGTGNTTITYTFENNNGCINSATDVVNVVAPEFVEISLPSTEFCSGEGVVEVSMSQAGGGANIYGPTISIFGVSLANDGNYTYYLDVSDLDGTYSMVYNMTSSACGGTDTVEFVVHQSPVAFIDFLGADISNLSDTVSYPINWTLGGNVYVNNQQLIGTTFDGPVWQAGQHEIICIVEDNYCSSSDSVIVYVLGADGIEEIVDISSLITVYPNPVTTFLNVDMEKDMNISEVQIISIDGKIVHQSVVEDQKYFSINVADYPNNTYLIRLKDKDGGFSSAMRFIKQ